MFTILLVPFLAAMFLAINMGGSGTAPSFAAAYGAGIIRKDIIPGLFGLFVFFGALLAGKEVALTISRGILPNEYITLTLTTIILVSVGLALLLANLLGVPQSTTQATVFALAGPAAYLKVLKAKYLLLNIVPAWFLLPLIAFVLAFLVGRFFYHPVRRKWPTLDQAGGHLPMVDWLVIAASCFVAFSIGSNNVANAAGPIAAMVVNELNLDGSGSSFMLIMTLSVLLVAPCFGIGSSLFGAKVIRTTGKELLEFGPLGATIISMITATLLLTVSVTRGIPSSLVQMNTFAIIGLGISEHGWREMLKDTPVLKIVSVWFAAPLIAMILSVVMTMLAERLGML